MKYADAVFKVLFLLGIVFLLVKIQIFQILIVLCVSLTVVKRTVNFLTKKILKRGSFQQNISVPVRGELSAIFDHIVSDNHVKGKVTVTRTKILACGCQEPMPGKELLTVNQAQTYMHRLVSEFDNSSSDVVYFTFKTDRGNCTVSYRMIGQKGLERERANMWTFPPSAKYATKSEDKALGILYNGSVDEYSSLLNSARAK